MNWRNIRVYNNSQNNAFEELVCQLARQEKSNGYKKFIRNGTPDGGVECFWQLENGKEYAWQAKYVFNIDSVIAQADKSYNTALKSHPDMCTFVVAIPFDFPDPQYEKGGKAVKSASEKWDDKVSFWEEKAKKENRNVTVVLWNASALVQKMMKPENEGMRYYWFNGEEFTTAWFRQQLENVISDLGPRYSPELNVQLEISKKFEYLRRSPKAYSKIQKVKKEFQRKGSAFIKEISNVNPNPEQKEKEVQELIENISAQLELSGYGEMEQITFSDISLKLNTLENIVDEIGDCICEEMGKDFYSSKFYGAYTGIENIIYEIQEMIDNRWLLLNNPLMLIYGEAGTGKSHLLADICKREMDKGVPAVLILGDYFTSSVNPREQIRQLFQSNLNYSSILGVLNALGQAKGERIVFAIDALNEGEGSIIWPKFLVGMITEIKKFPWVGLVVSVRSDNMDEVIPQDCKNRMVNVLHTGFEECVDEACDNFFEHYNISFNIPILTDEFCNALYLKLFCETFKQNQEMDKLPSIVDVFNGYMNHVNVKLSKAGRFRYEESINLVELSIQKIAARMAEEHVHSLSYKDALAEVNSSIKEYCSQNSSEYKNFLDALIKENILKSGIRYGEKGKFISFSYERMGDYFMLCSYLAQKKADEEFVDFFKKSEYFKGIFGTNGLGKGSMINMLSILLPDFYDTELLFCNPEKHVSGYIIQGFLKSLIWRKNKNVDDRIISWIKKQSARNVNLRLMVIDETLPLCASEDNPFNAMFIHENYLKNERNDRRDAWWSSHINEKYEYANTLIYRRLISWSLREHNNQKLSNESRKLLGIILAWFCTSNNRKLRDNASKALVYVYKSNPIEILDLFMEFEEVQDLYVIERLYAAAYGAVVYCDEKNIIKKIGDYVLENIFRKEEVFPHILIRDYALGIVQYALSKGIYEEDEKVGNIIKAPYKSKFPVRFPSEKTIDKLAGKYKENNGFSYVVDSMDTGIGYGDFGRYIFKNVLDKFEGDIDIDKVRRWVIKRTLQLGFDPKIHDVNLPGYFGRRGGVTERIGKKYQWIALYEILARLQDRYKARMGWKYENIADYFENAEGMGMRNFDPTLLLSKTFIDGYRQPDRRWYCNYEYLDATYDIRKWLNEPISFEKSLIELIDLYNRKWMALCSYPSWNEYKDDEDEKVSSKPEKIMDAMVQSIIIRKSDIIKWEKWIQEYPQLTRCAIEPFNINSMFYGENYWNISYNRISSNADKEGWSELIIDGNKTNTFYANTSQRHIWEGEYDYSKEDTIAFDIPTKIIIDGLNLQDKKEIGEYYDKERCICFNPGINQVSNHLLLIDKEALTKWLEESGLCIIWAVSVEKRIQNGFYGTTGRAEWYGTYKLLGGEVKGKLKKVKDNDFNIESDKFRAEFANERICESSDQGTGKLKQIMAEYMGDFADSDESEQFDL